MPNVSTPVSEATPAPTATPDLPSEAELSYRRVPFVTLTDPSFVAAPDATYLKEDELVLGLEWQGEARAYPLRMIWFHHVVNDLVSGRPFLITY